MKKPKICKVCLKPFYPRYSTLQPVCSPVCAVEYNKPEQVEKRVKAMKQDLKTHKDYLNALQVIFNKYIRLRDANKPCISCGSPLTGKYDAGHFKSVGAHPSVRFDEDNVHGQCVSCNQHKHGNGANYAIGLQRRISWEKLEALHEKSLKEKKYSVPELLELMALYKQKIKNLQINQK